MEFVPWLRASASHYHTLEVSYLRHGHRRVGCVEPMTQGQQRLDRLINLRLAREREAGRANGRETNETKVGISRHQRRGNFGGTRPRGLVVVMVVVVGCRRAKSVCRNGLPFKGIRPPCASLSTADML